KFATQKDRRRCPSAAEVQHPHAGPQVQRRREPLGHPERIRPPAGAGHDPFRVVLRRAGKSLRNEPLVQGHVDLLYRTLGMSRAWMPERGTSVGGWVLAPRLC